MTATGTVESLGTLEERARRQTGTFGDGALIVCDSLVRIYQSEGVEVQALQGLDLLVEAGELLAIVGASGSGTSSPDRTESRVDLPEPDAPTIATSSPSSTSRSSPCSACTSTPSDW